MKHALFDVNGFPVAFYAPEISGDGIPPDTVEITDEQWQELIDHQGRRRWTGGAVEIFTPPPGPDPVQPVDFTYKVDLFRRATEDECEVIEGLLEQLTSKMRRLFEGAQRLEHNADEFTTLQQAAVSAFGPARAAELLAPSA